MQRAIGQRADREDDQIDAAPQDLRAMLGDRRMAGAFGGEVWPGSKRVERRHDFDRPGQGGAGLRDARRAHQDRADLRGLAGLQALEHFAGDGAMSDQQYVHRVNGTSGAPGRLPQRPGPAAQAQPPRWALRRL